MVGEVGREFICMVVVSGVILSLDFVMALLAPFALSQWSRVLLTIVSPRPLAYYCRTLGRLVFL